MVSPCRSQGSFFRMPQLPGQPPLIMLYVGASLRPWFPSRRPATVSPSLTSPRTCHLRGMSSSDTTVIALHCIPPTTDLSASWRRALRTLLWTWAAGQRGSLLTDSSLLTWTLMSQFNCPFPRGGGALLLRPRPHQWSSLQSPLTSLPPNAAVLAGWSAPRHVDCSFSFLSGYIGLYTFCCCCCTVMGITLLILYCCFCFFGEFWGGLCGDLHYEEEERFTREDLCL